MSYQQIQIIKDLKHEKRNEIEFAHTFKFHTFTYHNKNQMYHDNRKPLFWLVTPLYFLLAHLAFKGFIKIPIQAQ